MPVAGHDDPLCRRVEPWAAALLVTLKSTVLFTTWGRAQGFDAPHWLAMARATHWFQPLPPPRALIASYHPPLSYLLGRLVAVFVPREVAASQVLSTLSLLGAFFALRSALRHIKCLWTLPGLVLLYGGFSIPLLVWLAVETGYDGPVFFWFMLALAQAVHLFWDPLPDKWWHDKRTSIHVALLGLTLAAGLLTKFNSLIAMLLPFLVVSVRHGTKSLLRNIVPLGLPALISTSVVAPLFYHRYYAAEGHRVPAAMDWQRPLDLSAARVMRDAAPFHFLANMLRPPTRSITESQYPVVDSFFHSIWLQIWKRDGCLGLQLEPSITISNFYIMAFPIILLGGSAWFFLRQRRIGEPWRHAGWVLFWIAIVFCASALAFAWNYPLWDWRVFKGKYITPAVLWIAYAASVPFNDEWTRWPQALVAWHKVLVLALLAAFVVVNHALPVY
jgi:hypothetical protein